ncbi:ribonucleases P/MRP protein subunit POP1 [Engystomops pustulosus]|uniref:ribonucleases P/MRP protein subunit POP1 n=1 Tax=Engystomops pustulosus TaxID=76066 RepID=UPI003AFA3782
MSTAKEKKYAKRMRNQPSSVSLDPNDGPTPRGGRGSHQPYRGSNPGSSNQQQRGGKGEEGSSESQPIPKYVTATVFAGARAAEIKAMLKAVSQKSSNTLVFQSLPRHMRRRAMGHTIKRLPRRLREMAKKEMEKTVHQKKEQSKSKCRKARRRHGNLQLEFNRRQKKTIWLETHIWHTKRYHMLKKWGYNLADRPTMKSYRACYRAMSNHCLLQDLSYYCCVELLGKEEDLLKALARLCNVDTGPTFMAAPCISGKRQGSLVLYRADKYPGEALGHVTFIWKPRSVLETADDKRQLWMWMHPALKEGVLKELRLVCECEDKPDNFVCVPEPAPTPPKEEPPASVIVTGRKRKWRSKGEKTVPVKKIIGDGTRPIPDPYYWTSTQTGITIRDLTMEIVRYRLVGPMSNCVLSDALHVAPLHKETEDPGPHSWWADYCRDPDNVLRHGNQESLFKLLKGLDTPAMIPSGTVLGLTVGDPRLNLPNKRTKSYPNPESYEDRDKVKSITQTGVPMECTQSLIWSSQVRSHVTDKKVSEQEINKLKSELLVPGSKLELGNKESKIPILLIQQPGKITGNGRIGWGSGWDICLPKGWGMAFWIPLIYRGVRVGGLQQGLQHYQYMGAPYVPGDFPDTPAGVQSALEAKANLLEKYTRRPPAKRTNFIKHGVLSPFHCPWDQLTREWEMLEAIGKEPPKDEPQREKTGENPPDEEMKKEPSSAAEKTLEEENAAGERDFSVLRSKKILKILSAAVSPVPQRSRKPSQPHPEELSHILGSVLRDFPRSLAWVRLSMMTKGSPELHSMICIPSEEDYLQLQKDKSFQGPVETKHGDHFKNKVLKQKKERKKEKKNRKTKPNGDKNDKVEEASGSDDLTLGVWPSPLPEVTSHCSRKLLGYVTHGDFSLAVGFGEALGFVSVTGLAHMLLGQPPDKTGLVLIRNPTSFQYRFAKLTIEV